MNTKGKLLALIAGAGILSGIGAMSPAYGDESRADRPVHCLSLIRIKDSDILDNQHIVFETVGHKYYLNQLSHPCPGLTRDKAFMYRTSLDQLCDLDIITVLDDYGFGLQPGASCGLGVFEPVSKEQVDGLKASLEAARKAKH